MIFMSPDWEGGGEGGEGGRVGGRKGGREGGREGGKVGRRNDERERKRWTVTSSQLSTWSIQMLPTMILCTVITTLHHV